ncbi:receptor-like protein kinase FERONIA [Neltuma alba]|uniref:receptor-like protein kinase FERONIA n=1 Tax=Neltuma alba TaxID=207710 RepID=UPI0010A52B47|nr:receptor-like protein kinase FERONIA [Prosopis alba]
MVLSLRKIEEPTVCFSLIIFLFHSQHLFTIPVTSFAPAERFSINCGSPSAGPQSLRFLLPEQVPYATARLSRSEFTYSFEVPEGQKFVRLFFYPAAYDNFDRSNALFSVKAGDHTLLKDFNASLTADNDDDPEQKVFREYCVNVEPGHRLNITFTPSSTNHPDAYAFINGIEVVAIPTNLYYKKAGDPALQLVNDENNRIRVDNNTALEMVYRINVGKDEIPAEQDTTGLLRDWHGVTGYGYAVMQTLQDLEDNDFDAKLIYPNDLLKDAAPEDVYLTAETSKDTMTWEFKVDSMFAYMIRLHFCELDQRVQKGERVFQILIADTVAEPQIDVLGTPKKQVRCPIEWN